MAIVEPGTIIFLNGVASSGKTSLAKAIQEVFDEPYLHIGIDLFWSIFPWGWHGEAEARWQHAPIPHTDPPKTATPMPPYAQLLHAGIYHTAAALARIGHNVVIDHVLYDPTEVPVMVRCWRDLPVWLVGLHCPLTVLRARAASRPERLAVWPEYVEVVTWQYDVVHANLRACYDLEIDTSQCVPGEAALLIKQAVTVGREPRALQQLAAQLDASRV